MRIVVDASIVVAILLDSGRQGQWASRVLRSAEDLMAPELMLIEVFHALRRLERLGQLSVSEADFARNEVLRFRAEMMPFAPFADRVWELRQNLTTYDACYVATAEAFDAALATLDTRLARAPGIRCETLSP